MIQQQTVLFVYWSLSSRLASMIAEYGTEAEQGLVSVRVSGYDEGSDESVVYEVRTMPPAENAGSAYIRTQGRKGQWLAELGMLNANNGFLPLLRSAPVRTGYGSGESAFPEKRRHSGNNPLPFPLLPVDFGFYSTYTIYPPPKQEGEKP
ncbi:DUF4912 domain-containing protein [Paenibacillus chitinolyticus]|uniref:DUF4912 domain-containing protein n=1 Tax=Paenibacillus chitinolyticus TaxID=79263 RepID=UPI002DB91979|nr:DUF4912 domain-containing protein [Paenibacillus chitinolyticus]MEC0247437.1 DUF4912 domain-containing protein [Paenibacillus chitinolyticus]